MKEIMNYDMRGQQISPDEPINFRPAHTLEMYGAETGPNITEMKIAREETYLDQLPTNHGVPMNFGGNPYSEKVANTCDHNLHWFVAHNTPHLAQLSPSLLSTSQLDQHLLKSICREFQE